MKRGVLIYFFVLSVFEEGKRRYKDMLKNGKTGV